MSRVSSWLAAPFFSLDRDISFDSHCTVLNNKFSVQFAKKHPGKFNNVFLFHWNRFQWWAYYSEKAIPHWGNAPLLIQIAERKLVSENLVQKIQLVSHYLHRKIHLCLLPRRVPRHRPRSFENGARSVWEGKRSERAPVLFKRRSGDVTSSGGGKREEKGQKRKERPTAFRLEESETGPTLGSKWVWI